MYLIVFNFIGLPNKVATEGFFLSSKLCGNGASVHNNNRKNHKARQWFPTVQLISFIYASQELNKQLWRFSIRIYDLEHLISRKQYNCNSKI